MNEAEQLLARREPGDAIHYAKFLGDIDIGDNILLGKGGSTIISKKGCEWSFFEILSIRGGDYVDALLRLDFNQIKANYNTEGLGLSLIGILKTVQRLNPQLRNQKLLNFLTNHLDVQYNTGSLNAGEGHSLDKTQFKGISMRFF